MHTFTITDSSGSPHAYTTTPFRASEGIRIRVQIGALVSQPVALAFAEVLRGGDLKHLARMFGATFGTPRDANGTPISKDHPDFRIMRTKGVEEFQAWLAGMDARKITAAINAAILDAPEDLFDRLLSKTTRDGEHIDIDAAYSRNYTEFERVLWEVMTYNGFLSLPDIALASSG